MDDRRGATRPVWIYVGFVALAVLAGPVRSFVDEAFGLAWLSPAESGYAVAALAGGVGLVTVALLRRERMPVGADWIALAGLVAPQLLADAIGRATGHDTPWGVRLLLGIAAPVWLGLLSALELVRVATPRAAVGAGIAGVGAVCLVMPTDAYRVEPQQAWALVLHLLMALLTVVAWGYAQRRLAAAGVLMCAGCYLFISGIVEGGFAFSSGQGSWRIDDWRSAGLSVLVGGVMVAGLWWLWFWLLRRMTLAAFCMGALAAWVASLLPALAMGGVRQWRVDLAVVIAVAATVIGVRARVQEEQPMALGLGGR
jgi:hypothetical protein